MMKITLFAFCLYVAATAANAAQDPYPFPAPTPDNSIGVAVHPQATTDADLQKLQDAGVHFVRADFLWQAIQLQGDGSNIPNSAFSFYDDFVNRCAAHNLKIYGILCYGNSDHTAPYAANFTTAFNNYATAVVNRYSTGNFADKVMAWELFNEPNNTWSQCYLNSAIDANRYMEIANTVLPNVRSIVNNNNTGAKIVGPAIGCPSGGTWDQYWNYLRTCADYGNGSTTDGLCGLADGISIHAYGTNLPEGMSYSLADNGCLAYTQDAIHNWPVPIISGEWGYSQVGSMTAQTQADYCARMMLVNMSQGIPLSVWYDAKNDSDDPSDSESNFGLLDSNGNPKPAYYALKTLHESLTQKIYTSQVSDGNSDDYIFAYQNTAGRKTYAAWTKGSPAVRNSISLTGGSIRAYLTGTPMYLGEAQQLQTTGTCSWSTATWGNSTGGVSGGWVAGSQAKLTRANQTVNVNTNVNFSGIQFGASGISVNAAGGSLVLGPGGGVINNGTATGAYNATIGANIISGGSSAWTCPLVKSGAGQLTLGGANSFLGNLIIAEGTVKANNTNALSGPVVTLNNSNSLTFGTGIGTFYMGGIAGGGNLALKDTNNVAIALHVGANNTTTGYSGILSGGGSLVKEGTGDLILSGTNTYSGPTTINGGSIVMGNAQALGSNPASMVTLAGGALALNGYNFSGHPLTIASNSSALTNWNTGSTSRCTPTSAAVNSDFGVYGSGNIELSGSFSASQMRTLTKSGTCTLTLSGSTDNAYLGLDVQANSGPVILNKVSGNAPDVHAVANIYGIDPNSTVRYADTGAGDYQVWQGGTITLNGGTLDFNGNHQDGTSMNINATGSTIANSASTPQFYRPSQITVSPSVDHFYVNAVGTVDLQTSIVCGTNNGTVWPSLIKTGAGQLLLGGANVNQNLTVNAVEGTIALNKGTDPNVYATSYAVAGPGGTIRYLAGGDHQIAPGGWVNMQGGTIDWYGHNQTGTDMGITGSGSTLANTAASTTSVYSPNSLNYSRDFTVNTVGNLEIIGAIVNNSGSYPAMTKTGAGVLTLSGAASNYCMTLIASQGTVKLNKTNAYAAVAAQVLGGTVQYTGTNDQIAGGNWISLQDGTLDLNGRNQSGVAFETVTGHSGTLTNTAAGTTSVLSPTTMTIGGALNVSGAGNVTINGPMSGSSTLTKTGTGSLNLSGVDSHTGATTISGGTLRLSGLGTINSTNGFTLNSGGTLLQDNASTALNRSIAFNGGTLGGTATYAYPTASGTLTIGNGSHLSPGDPTVDGGNGYGIGTFTVAGVGVWTLGMNSSTLLDYNFGTANGSSVCDLLQLSGGTSRGLTLDGMLNISGSAIAVGSYTIITGATTITDNGLVLPADGYLGHHWSYSINGGSVIVTASPEPGTFVLMAIAGLCVLGWCRKGQ